MKTWLYNGKLDFQLVGEGLINRLPSNRQDLGHSAPQVGDALLRCNFNDSTPDYPKGWLKLGKSLGGIASEIIWTQWGSDSET